jgi:UPF0755 protein
MINLLRRHQEKRLPSWTAVVVPVIFVGLFFSLLLAPVTRDTASFEVRPGDGASSVATRLKDEGIVRSRSLYLLSLVLSGNASRLQPGAYDLRGARTFGAITDRLTSGFANRLEVTITVREGWNLRQIQAELACLGFEQADDFFDAVGEPGMESFSPPADWLERYPFLKTRQAGTSLEGLLFPDTYRIYRDAPAEEAARVMLDNFGRKMTGGVVEAVQTSGRGFLGVLTMASVVEREVQTPEDRRLVADILWRRLDRGMRLQADSTVNYATGASRPSATAADLEVESPYNTYMHAGLPPGPISNPGLDAIAASAAPMANDFWYFLTDVEGGVHYAKTYDEHLANKARYLR